MKWRVVAEVHKVKFWAKKRMLELNTDYELIDNILFDLERKVVFDDWRPTRREVETAVVERIRQR